MALGTPTVQVEAEGTTGTVTTGSVTVAAGTPLFIFVAYHRVAGTPTAPTLSNSLGLAMPLATFGSIIGPPYCLASLSRCISSGNAITFTVTPGATTPDSVKIAVFTLSGASGGVGNANGASNATGDPSTTLGTTPAVLSTVVSCYYAVGTNAVSPPTNFTELTDAAVSGLGRWSLAYDAGSAGTGTAWSTTNTQSAAVTVEVKEQVALTANAGSYTLTGTSAGLKRGYRIVAAAGSYALTGTPATLRRGYRLTAAAGSYTITGAAAALHYGRRMVAGAGSYILTGSAVTLRRDSDPTFVRTPASDPWTLTPGSGSGWTFERDDAPDPWA